MERFYAKCTHKVSAIVKCESILFLIQDKVASIVGCDSDDVEFDKAVRGFCLQFEVDGDLVVIDMEFFYQRLIKKIGIDIALRAIDFEFEYEEDDIELNGDEFIINGTENHIVLVETWDATRDEPGNEEIYDEAVDFDEKRAAKYADSSLAKIEVETMRSILDPKTFVPYTACSVNYYDRKLHRCILKEFTATEKAIKIGNLISSTMSFTDDELIEAFSKVSFRWEIDNNDVEYSDYDYL